MADFNPDQYLKEKTSDVSSFNPDQYLSEKTGEKKDGMLSRGLKYLDSYTGGPIRAGILAAQEARGDIGKMNSAFWNAGAEKLGNPDLPAPSLKQAFERAGLKGTTSDYLSDAYKEKGAPGYKPEKGGLLDPSLAGIMGTGADLVTDVSTYAGEPIMKGMGKVASTVADTGAGKAVIKGAEYAGEKAKGLISKAAETFTGAPKGDTSVLINRPEEILKKAKKYDNNLASASDATKAKWNSEIQTARKQLNQQITDGIEKSYKGVPADTTSVVGSLEAAASKLDPIYHADDIAQINEKIAQIKDAGTHDVARLYTLKQELLDMGSGAIRKDGQIFIPGNKVQKAMKNAGGEANKILTEIAPEIKVADKNLSQLRHIEKKLGKTVLEEGATNSKILAAGSGNNKFQRGLLQKLSDITGGNMVKEAEDLSAMRTFADPSWLPMDSTGKSFTRMAAARMAAGGGIGYETGGDLQSTLTGAALSSPAALKYAITTANKGKGLLKGFSELATTPQGRALLNGLLSDKKAQLSK